MKRIVITGLGMINALGLDKESAFSNILKGKCGVTTIQSFDIKQHSVQIAAEIKNFDPSSVLNGKEVKKADRFIQLGLKAAKEAMIDAKFSDDLNLERFGVAAASGIGGITNIEENSIKCNTKGPKKISPFFIPSVLINMLGGIISIHEGLKGPNLSSSTACAAGTHAICEAAKSILVGTADKMLVIGAESAICPVGIGGFASMKSLSTRNSDPQTASRPFDADRDGFVMGEGAGALVLESYDDAIARGAIIYGEIIGFGESADANHITTPTLDGPLRAMREAYKMAGKPKIDYINAHGTSTPMNDKNETDALKELFGGKEKCPPTSSIKGQIGHCLGASGTIEAVVCLMSMRDNILPPTINMHIADKDCNLDYITEGARKVNINITMSNSFGFGGTNAVIIFKKMF